MKKKTQTAPTTAPQIHEEAIVPASSDSNSLDPMLDAGSPVNHGSRCSAASCWYLERRFSDRAWLMALRRTVINNHASGSRGSDASCARSMSASCSASSGWTHHWRAYSTSATPCSSYTRRICCPSIYLPSEYELAFQATGCDTAAKMSPLATGFFRNCGKIWSSPIHRSFEITSISLGFCHTHLEAEMNFHTPKGGGGFMSLSANRA